MVAGATVAGGGRRIESVVHDLADGAGAAAALGAAAEAAVNLPGRARPNLRRDNGADIVVAENIAGADNHQTVPRTGQSILQPPRPGKRNRPFLKVV